MNVRVTHSCTAIALFINVFLIHVTTKAEAQVKGNGTLDAADERAFFSKLRKSIKRHSSSSEEIEDSPDRCKPELTHFGEALVSYHLSEAEETLREDLEDYMKNASNDFSAFTRYKAFMTSQMHPLVDHYYIRAKRGKDNDKYCDFVYILVPRIGAGNIAYVIHFKIIADPKKLKKEAKDGLNAMKKAKVGHDLSKKWSQAERHIQMIIIFCGSDLALLYSKKIK